MIEIPETYVLSEQIGKTLVSKTIKKASANAHPHKFAWFSDEPSAYSVMLEGKGITGTSPGTGYTCGGNTEIICDDILLVLSTPIKYHAPGKKLPKSHQLLLEFEDESHMSCTVQMWGSIFCSPVSNSSALRHFENRNLPDPLTDKFDEAYFDSLWNDAKPSLSAKAFLATEQRIPELGNGVLQDILFNAGIHPKRRLEALGDKEKESIFGSVKSTLKAMKEGGGRDTEKDLFNMNGGYYTILSKKTLDSPCRKCGGKLMRQTYLGGNIYFCEGCQPLI